MFILRLKILCLRSGSKSSSSPRHATCPGPTTTRWDAPNPIPCQPCRYHHLPTHLPLHSQPLFSRHPHPPPLPPPPVLRPRHFRCAPPTRSHRSRPPPSFSACLSFSTRTALPLMW